MKSIAIAIACAIFTVLYSSPVVNPSLPSLLQEGFFVPDTSWSNPQLGFIGDSLMYKKMRPCHASQNIGLHEAAIRGASQTGVLTWSIKERFNVQMQLGSGEFHWRWKQIGRNVMGQAKGGLIWYGDAKLVILEAKDTTFSADAQAGGWDWMDGHATSNGVSLEGTAHSKLRYWQVAAAVSQRISLFTPYLGAAINRTRFKVSHLSTGTGWMHARHQVGPFVGCSLSNGSKFLLNLEWRGWFEDGLSAAAQLRF